MVLPTDLVLGVLNDPEGLAGQTLADLGCAPDQIEAALRAAERESGIPFLGNVGFAPETKEALEQAGADATIAELVEKDSGGLLVALLSTRKRSAAILFEELGIDSSSLQERLAAQVRGKAAVFTPESPFEFVLGSALVSASAAATNAERHLDTGDLLEVLLREHTCVAARALIGLGVTTESLASSVATARDGTARSDDSTAEPR
jgi:ATP-dependent Clp protease ATP-binding subunit ClpA